MERQAAKTLALVFDEFLMVQKARISPKTFLKYQTIIGLYQSYLESYWPNHDGECEKVTKSGGKYCTTYGPEDATAGFSEFLGYFMPRKVLCGKETMQAAGTVMKKLAQWLADIGYVEDEDVEYAEESAGSAARNLPKAAEVLELLSVYVDETAPDRFTKQIEDHFWISKIKPGKIWLDALVNGSVIGPIPVPIQVTELCEEGWDIGGVVAKVGKSWRLVEVWNVSP